MNIFAVAAIVLALGAALVIVGVHPFWLFVWFVASALWIAFCLL